MQVFGPLSMVIAFLLFTNLNHDFIINLASVCGLIGVAGALVALYKIRCFGLFAFGIVNLLLVALNNFVYHTEGFIIYLPVVQKITFVSFLLWIGCINITLYHRHRKHPPAIH